MVERQEVGGTGAFRQHDRRWPAGHYGGQIMQVPGRTPRIDADHDASPFQARQRCRDSRARLVLCIRPHGILQVQHHRIGGAVEGLSDLAGLVPRREKQAA
jgi:hypothetical protein